MSLKKAILCVDDEEIILQSMKVILRKHFREYILEFALSGQEAIEVIEDLATNGVETQVIITDFLMPGMRGNELLIKLETRYPRMVKFVMTGMIDPSALESLQQKINLAGCIDKPWKANELVEAIRNAING